jgi:hypothetical protein
MVFGSSGVVGPGRSFALHRVQVNRRCQPNLLGRRAIDGESPVGDGWRLGPGTLSTTGHVESRGKRGGPPSKAQYHWPPIGDEYREGKVKSTPRGG